MEEKGKEYRETGSIGGKRVRKRGREEKGRVEYKERNKQKAEFVKDSRWQNFMYVDVLLQ